VWSDRVISRINKQNLEIKQESRGFPKKCAGVRHCVILVAPRRVRIINWLIEVGTRLGLIGDCINHSLTHDSNAS